MYGQMPGQTPKAFPIAAIVHFQATLFPFFLYKTQVNKPAQAVPNVDVLPPHILCGIRNLKQRGVMYDDE